METIQPNKEIKNIIFLWVPFTSPTIFVFYHWGQILWCEHSKYRRNSENVLGWSRLQGFLQDWEKGRISFLRRILEFFLFKTKFKIGQELWIQDCIIDTRLKLSLALHLILVTLSAYIFLCILQMTLISYNDSNKIHTVLYIWLETSHIYCIFRFKTVNVSCADISDTPVLLNCS